MSAVQTVIGLGFMFGFSLFFVAIAIFRETLTSYALASISCLVCGAINFIYDPTGAGQYVGWLFLAVGIVFLFSLLSKVADSITESRDSRFKVGKI